MLGAKWKAEMCWLMTKKAFDPRKLPFPIYQYMPCAPLIPEHFIFEDQFPGSFTHNGVKIHLSCTVSRQFGPGPDFIDSFYDVRSEEHTSELQSRGHLVCRLLLEKKKKQTNTT